MRRDIGLKVSSCERTGYIEKTQAELVRVAKWVQYAEGRSSWTPVQAVAEGALDALEARLALWIPDALEMKREYFSMNAVIV